MDRRKKRLNMKSHILRNIKNAKEVASNSKSHNNDESIYDDNKNPQIVTNN